MRASLPLAKTTGEKAEASSAEGRLKTRRHGNRSADLARGRQAVSRHSAETPPIFPTGTTVEVKLQFDEPAREVQATGRVAWSAAPGGRAPPGNGIQFTKITKDDLAFLHAYAARAKPRK